MERSKLHELQKHHGFTHPCVLTQSVILDGLINEYNSNFYKREKKPTA
ncbi:aspartyl-phosphate phosphatase Spo0E family protein [Paenibacillus peoriae]|nr:aspartyl-phosphate phosphatase Spo0E family protein [Paenibacillus peoriae]